MTSRAQRHHMGNLSVNGGGMAANMASAISIQLPAYTATTFYKTGLCTKTKIDTTAGNCEILALNLQYRSTSAITRLKIAENNAGKLLKVGTTLLVYKRRNA